MLYILLAALAAGAAVLAVRTVRFTPQPLEPAMDVAVAVDQEKIVRDMQDMIRCKTVSYRDASLEDDSEFEKLIALLPTLYPEVHRVCSFERLPDRALLFCWRGERHDAPAVLMAHYDVVPVEEENWEKPPFDAVIEDGVLWGRGSLDTKVTLNGVLSAANTLIGEGFVPAQDVYFAFSGGEEVNGEGAPNIVSYFEEKGITPALVVDEGGGVVENVFPGVKRPCGVIGIAEKGMLNLTLSVASGGGHASAPPKHTPVGLLSRAVCRVENKPFPVHMTKPVAGMFDTLGRHSTFLFRVIFANLWCFGWVLRLIGKNGGEINALMRTTVAFTQSTGSKAPNVIPPTATVTANMRLNPADTVAGAMAHIKKTVKDDRVELTLGSHMEPSPISQVDCPAWDKVAAAVSATWKGCVVTPYLMMQCSDSRHYGRISDHVYRFSAMDLTKEERATIHGNNERIRLDCAKRAVEFYIRLMRQC